MNSTPPVPGPFLRRGLLALAVAGLAGCASQPVVLADHAAMADIKRVAVETPGFPSEPTVRVLNAVSDRLGLVGLIAGAAVRSNRRDALKAMMASHGFDPQAYFQTALTGRLAARGLTALPEPADATRTNFLPSYAPVGNRDAVLDTVVQDYGFIALSDLDSAPYRPTVGLLTRLVKAQDRSVLMQDRVIISGDGRLGQPVDAPAQPMFRTFTEIEADPARAVASLRVALDAAADGVVKRLG